LSVGSGFSVGFGDSLGSVCVALGSAVGCSVAAGSVGSSVADEDGRGERDGRSVRLGCALTLRLGVRLPTASRILSRVSSEQAVAETATPRTSAATVSARTGIPAAGLRDEPARSDRIGNLTLPPARVLAPGR
jgi:hypothetical protein